MHNSGLNSTGTTNRTQSPREGSA